MFAVMKTGKIIIAIDGYSSTGKSTFARLLASALSYIYVDTGALYRGVTLFATNSGFIDQNNNVDEKNLQSALENLKSEFRYSSLNDKSELFLNGVNVEKKIRGINVSEKVSFIARLPFVREYVDKILHELGGKKGVVMDGRDIGTVVFPNAELKIFMTANPGVRAQRRYDEMKAAGENPDYDQILRNVIERDHIDENRDIAPLRRAPEAILIDNSNMTVNEQLEMILKIIEQRWNSLSK